MMWVLPHKVGTGAGSTQQTLLAQASSCESAICLALLLVAFSPRCELSSLICVAATAYNWVWSLRGTGEMQVNSAINTLACTDLAG